METYLLCTLLIVAVIDWFAVAKRIKYLEYIFKPAVILVLLLYIFLVAGFTQGNIWFVFGLSFSLVGDVFLMLPKKSFMAGLVLFMLAHVSYITGFLNLNLEFNFASVILFAMIFFTSYRVYRLVTSRKIYFYRTSLKIPVLLYAAAISTMLFCAALTFTSSAWLFIPSIMVSLGAFLFYMSDSIIALNRYIPGMQIGRVLSMITYHVGQGLVITGVIYQTNLISSY